MKKNFALSFLASTIIINLFYVPALQTTTDDNE